MTVAEKHRENARSYALLKAAGLCVTCKGTPVPGRVRCRRCIDVIDASRKTPRGQRKRRASWRRWGIKTRAKRAENDLCRRCGIRVRDAYRTCRPCRRAEVLRRLDPNRRQRHCSFCRGLGHTKQSCEARAKQRIDEYASARVAA